MSSISSLGLVSCVFLFLEISLMVCMVLLLLVVVNVLCIFVLLK